MNSLNSLMHTLRLGLGQNYHQSPDNQAHDADTLSGSVDLEDIISEYDEPSRKSRNTTTNDGQPSQSYFSLSASGGRGSVGVLEDETTSFYSALHDGFSLDEYELRNKYGQEFLWSNYNNSGERDTMLHPSDFQITWYDLTYTIRPRTTIVDILDECKLILFNSLSSASSLFRARKSANNYDLGTKENSKNNVNQSPVGGPGETVTIFKNVNGSFRSGELTAVLGPSGSGKTSLLNILSRRHETGYTGQIHVNETNHRLRINAIPQHDNLPECFTVRENLTFASRLKNPFPHQDHEKNVYRVSHLLGLDECLETRTKNISGGQQKRLAIAQELLSRPDILILDEPTSGLDSLTCLKTLSVLKDLVKASKKKMIDPIAIVLTIHQPQQEAFNLFDKVYVMADGGVVIYDGPPSKCTDFIEKFSGLKMPSLDYNPASFLIEIASGEYGQEPIDALANQVRQEYVIVQDKLINDRRKSLAKAEPSYDDIIETNPSVVGVDMRPNSQNQKAELYLDSRLAKSSSLDTGYFFSKTRILTYRCWTSMWRDSKQMAGRIFFHLMLPFLLAFMMGTEPGRSNACPKYSAEYSLLGIMKNNDYTSEDVQEEFLLTLENTAVIFMSIYSCISANIAIMTLTFSLDMRSCLKEYHNGWYSMNSYVFARFLSNIPMELTLPTATIALTYCVTGQNTGNGSASDLYRISITSLAVILGSCSGQITGMIFGAAYMGHITTALFASQGATLPFVLLSGFVARTKYMSKFVRALGMTSLYKHCLEIAFIARYGWNVCDCDPSQFQSSKEVVLTGVSDELRTFINNWLSTQDANSIVVSNSNSTTNESDLFQVIAKQISLYNTYGIEVHSCDQIKPYELYDYDLTESDLPVSFAALIALLTSMMLVLLLVVKLVTSYKTSL